MHLPDDVGPREEQGTREKKNKPVAGTATGTGTGTRTRTGMGTMIRMGARTGVGAGMRINKRIEGN